MNISSRLLNTVIVSITVILLLIGWVFVDNQRKGRQQDLEIYANFLVQEAERLDQAFSQLVSVSDLLKKNPIVIHVLDQHARGHSSSNSATLIVQKTLETIAGIDKISSVYLMDMNGQCVHSSNASFIGKNYGFRPYFKDAIKSGSGMYSAMGVTSQQPGIYYAQRVSNGSDSVGVAVIKIMPSFFNLHSLLSAFAQTTPTSDQLRIGLVTSNGFCINSQDNNVSFLGSLTSGHIEQLKKNRQFPPERVQSLNFSDECLTKLTKTNFVKGKNSQGVEFYLFKEPLLSTDLFLLHIIDAKWFRRSYRPVSSSYRTLLYMMGGGVVVMMILLYFLNRQHLEALEAAAKISQETSWRLQEKNRYETIINSNPEGFCLLDAASKNILEVNDSFCRLVGQTSEQIIGRCADDLFETSDLVSGVSGRPDWQAGAFEGYLRQEETKKIDIFVHCGEISSRDGASDLFFCFVADITEKNTQQKELMLFSRVVEQSHSGIVITDHHASIVYTNPAFTKITGYAAEEVLGKNPSILSSGETDPETIKVLWNVISSGNNWKGYLRNKKKDGTLYWEGMAISPVFDSQHRVTHYLAIKNDITERINLEQQIASKNAELELIVEHAAIGIAYIINHHYVWVSQAGAEMFGYGDKKNVAGLSSKLLFLDQDAYQKVIKRSALCFVEGVVFEDEQLMRRKDGSTFWCLLTGKVIDSNDLSKGAIWLTQDISAQKEVEQQLQLARDRAQQASQEKSSFLANMSHEIRTPMNSIIGMTSLALDTKLDAQQQYLLGTIRHSADFLLGIINNILDFSKIESGFFELDEHPFHIETVVTQVVQTMDFLARKKGLSLGTFFDQNLPQHVCGDELRLRQILANLIGNAIKFTDKGDIQVRASARFGDDERIILDFEVEDNGIGIAPDKQEDIFEAFVQADTGITRHFGGTGLGLSISYKLCRLMGGEMTVKSEPGKGATFIFSVVVNPVSAEEVHQLGQDQTDAEFSASPWRILLVDDNEANRFLAQALLKKYDHQIVEAKDGQEALTLLLEHHFDVILLDVQMPKLDGITTTQIIRDCEKKQGQHPEEYLPSWLSKSLRSRLAGGHIPIVALTAHALSEDRKHCLEVGMDGYAVKPFKARDILQAIQQAIVSSEGGGSKKTPVDANTLSEQQQQTTHSEKTGYLERITQHLREVYRLDDAQIEEMLDLSAGSLTETLFELKQGVVENEMNKVISAAHRARGGLLGLGLDDAADLAEKIEISAQEGRGDSCRKLVASLHQRIRPLLDLSVGLSGKS